MMRYVRKSAMAELAVRQDGSYLGVSHNLKLPEAGTNADLSTATTSHNTEAAEENSGCITTIEDFARIDNIWEEGAAS